MIYLEFYFNLKSMLSIGISSPCIRLRSEIRNYHYFHNYNHIIIVIVIVT